MARINIAVPPLSQTRYTGGIWCILQYANGLSARGHDVRIIPVLPCKRPAWLDGTCGYYTIPALQRLQQTWSVWRQALALDLTSLQPGTPPTQWRAALIAALRTSMTQIAIGMQRGLPYALRRAATLDYCSTVFPEADFTIATAYTTALPVFLYGSGHKIYFLQHYEIFFKEESTDPILAEQDARLSHHLPLHWIVNSSWLRDKLLTQHPQRSADLCNNAIDLSNYSGSPKNGSLDHEVRVISYGGRNAVWKGFREMAEALRLVRTWLPERRIRWLVYGDAILPPNNAVAPYESLGFLGPVQLAAAYRDADILLSASWYESFPLFPLEAMACGLPVITSAAGTEEYAVHGKTAEIVEAGNPQSIANGLKILIEDESYRLRLATAGQSASQNFTWQQSVSRMEELLLAINQEAIPQQADK